MGGHPSKDREAVSDRKNGIIIVVTQKAHASPDLTPSTAPIDATLDVCDPVALRASLRDLKHPVKAGNAVAPALLPEQLGAPEFLREHRVRYAYATGAMANGIASVELVEAGARAGLLSFFGSA